MGGTDFAANARSPRPSPRSLCGPCEACLPRWRRRPARPHRRPAHPIDRHAVPQSVRRRWMAHRPSLKARYSEEPPRLSLLCLRAIVLAHDLRERSAKQFERYQRARVVSRKAFKGRWRWLDTVGGGRFLVLPTSWGPAEARKALGGKHARRSNTQSVRRAPAPPSPFGHDTSIVTPSPALQQLRRAHRPCSHHAHR